MAAKKRLSAAAGDITAVWVAPEQLRAARLQAAVDSGASPQEIADLAAAPMHGEYREYHGSETIYNVVTPNLGDRLVWVHPPDAEEGWYERYDGDDDAYVPIITTTSEA